MDLSTNICVQFFKTFIGLAFGVLIFIAVKEHALIEKVTSKEGGTNPFVYSLTFDYIEHTRVRIYEGKEVPSVFKSEVISSTKLYHVNDEILNRVLALQSGAQRMFLMIAFKMSRNTERIRINKAKFLKLNGTNSPQTYYNAIHDLIDAGLLCHNKGDVYWVNTWVLFNGDRLKKYKDKINCVKKIRYRATDGINV